MKNEKKEKTIYQKLVEAVEKLPPEAVEKSKKEITRKGYDTTGYQYQFLVNVLNEVVGLGNWGFNYKILKETEGKWSNGKGFYEITADIKVWILENEKEIKFHCVGGHKSEMYADALKGAITNGFKKTVAFFGVGKKAYEGTIDDDYMPIATEENVPVVEYGDKECPICHTRHTGKYPKCLDCYRGKKTSPVATKKIVNEDAPPF